MKFSLFLTLSLSSFAAILSVAPHVTQASGQEGHGGDSYSAEFAAIADQLVTEIGGLPLDERYGINPVELGATIDQTLVDSTAQPLYLDGGSRLVDAINYPETKLILVSRPSWDEMSFVRRQLLVLHEYSSIMGLDDKNYRISAKVLLNLGQVNPEPVPTPTSPASPWPLPSYSPTSEPSGLPYPSPTGSASPVPYPTPSATFTRF